MKVRGLLRIVENGSNVVDDRPQLPKPERMLWFCCMLRETVKFESRSRGTLWVGEAGSRALTNEVS